MQATTARARLIFGKEDSIGLGLRVGKQKYPELSNSAFRNFTPPGLITEISRIV
jgi:hypothetical protein